MKREKKKKRKIALGYKILICLLLIVSLCVCAGTWLRVRIDTPYSSDLTIEELLALTGESSESVLTEMLEPELKALNEELYEATGVRLDSAAAMDLTELLLSGNYKLMDFDTILEKSEILADQAARATRTLGLLDRDMREIHETLVQVKEILSTGRTAFDALLIGLLALCLIGIVTVFMDHRFGILPYMLATGVLALLAQGAAKALNVLMEDHGQELLTLTELSFPFSLDRMDMDVFRAGTAPAIAFIIALATFLIALASAQKLTPAAAQEPTAPASAAPAMPSAAAPLPAKAPAPAPAAPSPAAPTPAAPVAPATPAAPSPMAPPAQPIVRTTPTGPSAPTPLPRRDAPARTPRPMAPVAPVSSAPAAQGWICPRCGARRAAADRFCVDCGERRPEMAARGWFCPNCGARRAATDRFCTDCGTKRPDPGAAAPAPAPQDTREHRAAQASQKDSNSSSELKDLIKPLVPPTPTPAEETTGAPAPDAAFPAIDEPGAERAAEPAEPTQDAEDLLDALLRRRDDPEEDDLTEEDIRF